MPRQVFISHASADRSAAETFCEAIEGTGIPCWIAFRDIPPGSPYSGAILDAIAASGVVVVILSSKTAASPHVLREVERAVHRRLPIVPVRVEDVMPGGDLEYFLSAVQWIDAFPGIRPDVVKRVVDGVRELAGAAAEPAAMGGAPAHHVLVNDIRQQMLASTAHHELRRLLHELDAVLHLHPHDPEARMLREDLTRAIDAAAPRVMYALADVPRARAKTGPWMLSVAAAVVLIAAAGGAILTLQRSGEPVPAGDAAPPVVAAPASPASPSPATSDAGLVLDKLRRLQQLEDPSELRPPTPALEAVFDAYFPELQPDAVRELTFQEDQVRHGVHLALGERFFVIFTVTHGGTVTAYLPRESNEATSGMELWKAMAGSPPGTVMRSLPNQEAQAGYERALAAWARYLRR